MKRNLVPLAVAFGVLGALALALQAFDWKISVTPAGRSTPPAVLSMGTSEAQAQAESESVDDGILALKNQSRAFVKIAENILPSVVSITSNRVITNTSDRRHPRFFGDELLQRFFDNLPEKFQQQGSGSGVIVSADGYILTNNHVVADADELDVFLNDGTRYKAELVGRDPKSDVAVIRIDAKGLIPAHLGNSDELNVGEWVLAAGNPFQLASSVTSGIVSAVGRSNIGLADYEDFIQTDAAINPGNSGGALINLDGDVVGINTAIATRSGGYQGIGFAIPINMASRIMDDLISDGKVVRGYLGVTIRDLDDVMADYYNLEHPRGALINGVQKDGPADKAGVKQGDLILEVNGQDVKDVDDLRFKISAISPGTQVDLGIIRDGNRKTLTAELTELPSEDEPVAEFGSGNEGDNPVYDDLGLDLEDLTRRSRREYDLPSDLEGALVVDVEALSRASKAGFRVGDVIVKVDDSSIEELSQLETALKDAQPGAPLRFLVSRDGAEIFLAMRAPE
jgi:serine protease Do